MPPLRLCFALIFPLLYAPISPLDSHSSAFYDIFNFTRIFRFGSLPIYLFLELKIDLRPNLRLYYFKREAILSFYFSVQKYLTFEKITTFEDQIKLIKSKGYWTFNSLIFEESDFTNYLSRAKIFAPSLIQDLPVHFQGLNQFGHLEFRDIKSLNHFISNRLTQHLGKHYSRNLALEKLNLRRLLLRLRSSVKL